METVLIILCTLFVGAVVGVIVGYLFGKRGVTVAEQRAAGQFEQIVELSNAKSALEKQVEMLQQQIAAELARNQTEIERLKAEFNNRQLEQEQRFKEAELQRREEFKQQLEQQLELVKSQLKQQTEQSNRESINEIMRPYREQLEQLKQNSIEDRATLQNEIKRFVETGGRLTREADRLVTALSGSVTIQGNLGEKLLADLLAGSGLKEGIQYKLQHTVRNEDGTTARNSNNQKMRPDAALIYPETNSILYIDSKFQLPDELNFENLEAERQAVVLKSFADKIKEQAKKLSDRNYDRTNNEGYTPLPYVIMFVPSEAALTAVTNYDKTLWQSMFADYRVCLASERNLLILIEMVRYMWQRQVTIDNYQSIISKAEMVMDRVTDFMTEFVTMETKLAEATSAAEKMRQLAGNSDRSIGVAVRNLVKLGVKPTKTQKKDRPNQLKSHLQLFGAPMDEEGAENSVQTIE